jgi:hypothetical protein
MATKAQPPVRGHGESLTSPAIPCDAAALDDASVDLVLSNLGPDMVLVGGQALSFWMDRFGVASNGMAISNDGDVLGKLSWAIELANAIKARVVAMPPTSRTSLVAQLRLPTAGRKERNIDVLHMLYTIEGLKKSHEFTHRVIQDSLAVEWRPGQWVRVMDPFDVLESRAQNAVGLIEEKGAHVVTQVRWAVAVAEKALMRLALDEESNERLGAQLQRLDHLARSQVGRRLLKEHGVELLDAVDVDALRALVPKHVRQLDVIEKVKVARAQTKRLHRQP